MDLVLRTSLLSSMDPGEALQLRPLMTGACELRDELLAHARALGVPAAQAVGRGP